MGLIVKSNRQVWPTTFNSQHLHREEHYIDFGNMCGTSLAMAAGFVIAQMCHHVDLDGALFLKKDCEHPMSYTGDIVSAPTPTPTSELWG